MFLCTGCPIVAHKGNPKRTSTHVDLLHLVQKCPNLLTYLIYVVYHLSQNIFRPRANSGIQRMSMTYGTYFSRPILIFGSLTFDMAWVLNLTLPNDDVMYIQSSN